MMLDRVLLASVRILFFSFIVFPPAACFVRLQFIAVASSRFSISPCVSHSHAFSVSLDPLYRKSCVFCVSLLLCTGRKVTTFNSYTLRCKMWLRVCVPVSSVCVLSPFLLFFHSLSFPFRFSLSCFQFLGTFPPHQFRTLSGFLRSFALPFLLSFFLYYYRYPPIQIFLLSFSLNIYALINNEGGGGPVLVPPAAQRRRAGTNIIINIIITIIIYRLA